MGNVNLRELMLVNIIWALNHNIDGLLNIKENKVRVQRSDLDFDAYEELEKLMDDKKERERMYEFFESVHKDEGFQWAKDQHPDVVNDYPHTTKFLIITHYA